MGFGNFLKGVVAQVNPWDRGKTYGSYNPKKKRQDEQNQAPRPSGGLTVSVARPGQTITVQGQNQPQIRPQRPENLFADLNNNLKIGVPQNPILSQNTTPAPQIKPGTVVKPTLSVTAAVPKQDIVVNGQRVSEIPDTPEEAAKKRLEAGLDAGKSFEDIARENDFDLDKVRQYANSTRPNYGIKEIARPKQSIGNRFRDVFDTNTQSDIYRRQQGNKKAQAQGKTEDIKPVIQERTGNIVSRTPIVGHVTKMLNTAGAQIPELSITADMMWQNKMRGDLEKKLQIAKKNGNQFQVNEINGQLDRLLEMMGQTNREADAAHTMFQKNSGGLFNAGTLYGEEASREGKASDALKDIVLPTATTMLDIYTLGQGAALSEGIKQGGLRTVLGKEGVNILDEGATKELNKRLVTRYGSEAIKDLAPTITKNVGRQTIAKELAGNYASGTLGAYGEGANTSQALKAGAVNSVLGTVPDVALPALSSSFRSRVLPKIFRGRIVSAGDVLPEVDDAALATSAETANQAVRPRIIPVRQGIPIDEITTEGLQIPVNRVRPEPGRLIREVTGDAAEATSDEAVRQAAEAAQRETAAAANAGARPDISIEGVTPRTNPVYKLDEKAVQAAKADVVQQYAGFLRDVGERNGTQLVPDGEGGYIRTSNNFRTAETAGKNMTKQDWLDEAERQLNAGKAEPGIQQAFDEAGNPEIQSMLSKGEQPDVPEGRPITVKQVNSIPVTDANTVVPTGLPETPGTVRATTAAAPANEAAQVAAAQTPVAARPVQLPAETQAILDNPKQFSKRQVAAARNQRKLARQLAKTQEDTAVAMERIQTASPAAASPEGYVATGEFGKSVNGGAYQKASRAAEMSQAVQETANMSPADILQTARKNQMETGGFNPRDMRNIRALAESKRVLRGTPEYNELRAILKEDGTIWGQQGALRNYTLRRTASSDELMNRFESKIYRLADDPTKIESKLFDDVEAAETKYTTARDAATEAYNRFTEAPTTANRKAYEAAMDAAEAADKEAKITEYKVADKALKGNKDIKQVRELEKMANAADLYQMDAVDASMLSGTGTFVRNFVNASTSALEEGVFGRPAAWLSRKFTGEAVGGGVGKGSIKGFKGGVRDVVGASKARAGNAGWNPLSHIKNWATTGNQLGDTLIDSQVTRNTLAHYTSVLKEQGYKGRELVDRAAVMARQDPDEVGKMYAGAARSAAGLGGGITRNNKIETIVKNMISDGLSTVMPLKASEPVAKLITRMTIGFPTAIGRSLNEGVKRFTLGTPTFIKALRTADPAERALLIKEGIKQAGTGGMVIPPLFYAMGANGLITGAYPSDPEERARWQREGITENSVNIGGNYYQLPGYLGAWALPGLFYASLGRNNGDFSAAAADTAKIVPSILPTDNMSAWQDVVNGRTDPAKFFAQTGASAVRAATPGGALLNQIAKSLDPTKNDTTTDNHWEDFVNKVVGGIPGGGNVVNIPSQEDDAGNVIKNPGAGALLFGASSTEQGKGAERTADLKAQVTSQAQALQDIGALSDPNLKGVLDDKNTQLYNKLTSGKELSQKEMDSLQDALAKGVSTTGEDTAYLEREQYDTNIAALKLKKKLMEQDKTTKPSDIKKMDTAIKRGEVYKENEVPYDMIEAYQSTGVDEWRKMGIPPGDKNYDEDAYDPEMYQKLWELDQLMTKAGVSYRKDHMDKNKFFVKEKKDGSGSGSGRSRASELSSDFGTLKSGDFAPKLRQYDTMDQASGSVPIIRTVRPNIVHKIGSSG